MVVFNPATEADRAKVRRLVAQAAESQGEPGDSVPLRHRMA